MFVGTLMLVLLLYHRLSYAMTLAPPQRPSVMTHPYSQKLDISNLPNKSFLAMAIPPSLLEINIMYPSHDHISKCDEYLSL